MEKKGQTYLKMKAINWPKEFLPGTTDNFTSNEVIIKDLSTKDIWIFLEDASLWSSYYKNIVDVKMKNQKSFRLNGLTKFNYTILGLNLEAIMLEYIPPEKNNEGRISWYAFLDDDKDKRIDIVHCWLIENLDGGRVRILSQTSQKGIPAINFKNSHPNIIVNFNQDWIDNLVKIAFQYKKK